MTDGPGAGFSWYADDMLLAEGSSQTQDFEVGLNEDYTDDSVYPRPDLFTIDPDSADILVCVKAGEYEVTLHDFVAEMAGVDTPATFPGGLWRTRLLGIGNIGQQCRIPIFNAGSVDWISRSLTVRTVFAAGDQVRVEEQFHIGDAELTDATVTTFGSLMLTYQGPAPEFGVYDTVFGRFADGPSPDRAAQVNLASDLTDSTGRLHEVRAT